MKALTLQEEKYHVKKQNYPVLFDKQFLKEYREKDVVTNAWNALAKEIAVGRFSLFSRKNN